MNKLVGIVAGREYSKNLTLRYFITPEIRQKLKEKGIYLILASNNEKAINQYKELDIKLITPTQESKELFNQRQREDIANFGAETRELINEYAKMNNYDYVIYLDDNIEVISIQYENRYKRITSCVSKCFLEIIELLFIALEKSNAGAVGLPMSGFKPHSKIVNTGFAYSLYSHRVDKNFIYENSTEEDILMSIYNGENSKPTMMLRGYFAYGKTGKTTDKSGNRNLYKSMLKNEVRGTFAKTNYPDIYTCKVSYNVKNNTSQKRIMKQHKHYLKKPKEWDLMLQYDKSLINDIENTYNRIKELSNGI